MCVCLCLCVYVTQTIDQLCKREVCACVAVMYMYLLFLQSVKEEHSQNGL